MKKQSSKFEIVDEQEQRPSGPQEQQPVVFVPSYPGEKEIKLSPEQIALLEAEREALVRSHLSGYVKPAVKSAPESAAVVTEPVVTPTVVVEPGAVAAVKARIAKLQEDHALASETRELEYRNTLAALLVEQGKLEVAEAASIDSQTSAKLKDVVALVRNGDGIASEIHSQRADAGAQRQDALRQRAARVVAQAAETRRLLKDFEREYSANLEAVASIPREEWLLGTPATSPGAQVAYGLYANLENGLIAISKNREVLTRMLRTDMPIFIDGELGGGFEAEIERLIADAARGWSQYDERAFVWAVTRLALANPEQVSTLQMMVRGVIGAAARLHDLKRATNVESVQTIHLLPGPTREQEIRAMQGENVGANWSVFGGGEVQS